MISGPTAGDGRFGSAASKPAPFAEKKSAKRAAPTRVNIVAELSTGAALDGCLARERVSPGDEQISEEPCARDAADSILVREGGARGLRLICAGRVEIDQEFAAGFETYDHVLSRRAPLKFFYQRFRIFNGWR